MNKESELIESLLLGGLIGATLGALVNNNKNKVGDDAAIGALAGAILMATYKANANALKTNLPVYIEENGVIYEVNSQGGKRQIKTIKKFYKNIAQKYKLK